MCGSAFGCYGYLAGASFIPPFSLSAGAVIYGYFGPEGELEHLNDWAWKGEPWPEEEPSAALMQLPLVGEQVLAYPWGRSDQTSD